MMRLFIPIFLLVFLVACEDYPRDPKHTWRHIQSTGIMEVGVLHNPPWAAVEERQGTGTEARLIKGFARQAGVVPHWRPFSYRDGVSALKEGRVHILIGGLCDDMHGKGEVGLTRPYLTEKRNGEECAHVLALRRGENRFLMELEAYLASVAAEVQP